MLEIVFGIFDLLLIGGYVFWDVLKIYKDQETAFQWFVVFQFSVLIVYLLARSRVERTKIDARITNITNNINSLRGLITHNTVTLMQEQFYSEFRRDITDAISSVDITHLDTQPPTYAALNRSEMENYYDNFARLVRNRQTVRFRRVERASPEKREWLESIVRDLTGRPNFSLACYITPDRSRKVGLISVQLVDGRKVYLVAIKDHVDAHAPRDICINDPKAAAMWLEYYNQTLWGKSLVVLESGTLNRQNWAEVQRNLNA